MVHDSQGDASRRFGNQTRYIYNGVGALPSYQYNNQYLVTQITNGRGQTTDYAYDAKGNVTRITDAISGANGKQYSYDATFNQITSITDELGRQTTYQLDAANGNVLSMTQVVGGTNVITRYTYTTQGQVKTINVFRDITAAFMN